MIMATTTPTSGGTQEIGSFFADLDQKNSDALNLPNYAVAAVDTTATSLAWIGSLGTLDIDSLAPDSWEAYHRSKGMYDAVSGVATMFAAAGQVTRGVRSGTGILKGATAGVHADVQSVAKLDDMMSMAQSAKATSVAQYTGFTTPNLTLQGSLDGADAIAKLTRANTYEDAAAWGASMTRKNSFKEAIGQELAIFAVQNQNEFFFPEDSSAWSYLTFGALGVGANMGIDVAMRRASQRKSMASAAALGSETAAAVQKAGGLFTHNKAASGVVGEGWQQLMSGAYGAERLNALENAADTIAGNSGGTLTRQTVLDEVRSMRLALDTGMNEAAAGMFKNRMPEAPLSKGVGSNKAVSVQTTGGADNYRVTDAVKKNPNVGIALADLGPADMRFNYTANLNTATDRVNAAQTKVDRAKTVEEARKLQPDLDAARGELATLNRYRAGVIENTAVANMNPNRRTPNWETAAGKASLDFGKTDAGLLGSSMRLDATGKTTRVKGLTRGELDHLTLNFDEATQLQKLTAEAVDSTRWVSNFWKEALAMGTAQISKMPFQVLDAMIAGKLAVPKDSLSPVAPQIRAMLAGGDAQVASLSQKLQWYAHAAKDLDIVTGKMDLMDAEKALNLRLTNDHGAPTLLGHAFEAAALAPNPKAFAESFRNSNDMIDDLLQMGIGRSGLDPSLVTTAMRDEFAAGLKGIGLSDKANYKAGIGALYHKVDVPTQGEFQVARLAAVRNAMHDRYVMESASPFVRGIAEALARDSIHFKAAGNVSSLFHDTFVKGNLVSTKTFAHRFQATIQAAHAVKKAATAAADAHSDAVLTPIATAVKELIKSPAWDRAAPQISGAHQLISRGASLIDTDFVKGANAIDVSRPGMRNLLKELGPLKGAPDDVADWKLFDISIAANEGRYVVLELGDEAADMLNTYAKVSLEHFEAINSLRRASGVKAIERLNGHLPVMNFNRYEMRYLQDPNTGRIVGYVKGKTVKEADAALAAARRRSPEYMEAKVTDIKAHYDAIDEVFMSNLRDMSGIKQNGTSKGKNADFRLDASTDLVQDMMIAMRNTYSDIGRRTTAAMFSRPLSEAQQMQKRIGQVSQGKEKEYFTAVEQWQNLLLGKNDLPEGSLAGRTHTLAEDLANAAVGKFGDAAAPLWRGMGELMEAGRRKVNDVAGREMLSEAGQHAQRVLDNHKPFTHLANDERLRDYLKVDQSVDPFRIASALQLANRGTTAAFLKIANLAHPILNYAGAVVTMPAVLRALEPMKGETVEQWTRRSAGIADHLDPEKMIATISPHKLMIEGFELMLKDPAAVAYATKRGFIEANMLEELNRANDIRPSNFVSAMEGVAKWSDFINTPINAAIKKRTGIDQKGITLSERSETGSRAWMHMTGYALAKRNGRDLTEDQLHSFAHWFANQNVADFAPDIRGDAFNGVAGIPFGLFQSYAINLYQRMFRYVEDGNKRALLVQAATQASMFGVEGLPGWDALNAQYFNEKRDVKANAQGATTLNERIYSSFGKDVADILMGGTLSNLPRLAGADGAINLFSSGDMNPRGLSVPSMGLATQAMQGISEGMKVAGEEIPKMFTGEDFDAGRIAQVFANYAPSRGHRSLAELALGESVDRRGNLVQEDTRSGLSLVARVIGTRTRDEIMTSEAMWANSTAQRQRVADMGRVRDQMLRQIRNGDVSEQEMSYFLADYITAGGDTDQWARWLDFTTKKATMTKDERALESVVKKTGEILPHNFAAVSRLANAGVRPPEEMLNKTPTLN